MSKYFTQSCINEPAVMRHGSNSCNNYYQMFKTVTYSRTNIFSDLRTARNALLALFNSQVSSPEKMDEASTAYFAIIQGLFHVPPNPGQEQSTSSESHEDNEKDKDKEKDKKEKSGMLYFLEIHISCNCIGYRLLHKPIMTKSAAYKVESNQVLRYFL